MPLAALSLVGFIRDEKSALTYLEKACVPPAGFTPASLRKQWTDARGQLGAPYANAGSPEVKDIPSDFKGYLAGVRAMKEFANVFKATGLSFKLVEIAPLLAYQYHVLEKQVALHTGSTADVPPMDEMVKKCLPQKLPEYKLAATSSASGVVLKCSDMNVSIGLRGVLNFGPNAPRPAGILCQPNVPFVTVSKFGDRYFLTNGYHRTYGFAKRKATHIPCILQEVTGLDKTGTKEDGSTFGRAVMEDPANRPTMAHFIDGRAFPVGVRKVARVIHVAWSECDMEDE